MDLQLGTPPQPDITEPDPMTQLPLPVVMLLSLAEAEGCYCDVDWEGGLTMRWIGVRIQMPTESIAKIAWKMREFREFRGADGILYYVGAIFKAEALRHRHLPNEEPVY